MGEISDVFTSLGFMLTPLSKHNLGSSNRIAVLDNCYLEILGWEANTTPVRKEIANEPCGFNALVFRTNNADFCYQSLKDMGFEPNPIQDLSRPVRFGDGLKQAKFRTIRFTIQPIPGIRIYFCEHVTPEYIWQEVDMDHPNGIVGMNEIVISSPSPEKTFSQLKKLLMSRVDTFDDVSIDGSYVIDIKNCQLKIKKSISQKFSSITSLLLCGRNVRKDLQVDENIFLRFCIKS